MRGRRAWAGWRTCVGGGAPGGGRTCRGQGGGPVGRGKHEGRLRGPASPEPPPMGAGKTPPVSRGL